MDIMQQRDLIYGLRNLSRCLNCTREDVIDALSKSELITKEETDIVKGVSRMLDNLDKNTGRSYKK